MRRPQARVATAILCGYLADRVWADPRRGHPVAGYGKSAARLRTFLYRDSRAVGAVYTLLAVGAPVAAAAAVDRRLRNAPAMRTFLTSAAVWATLGGASLIREAATMQHLVEGDDIGAARNRLGYLCARDPSGLDGGQLARATVESVAENTSDAVVAPLFWAAVGGLPGVVGYRAVNTLDAMVGYRTPRYERFGWASARLDDMANLAPARLCGALGAALATTIGGAREQAWHVMRRDARHHPSPNAGFPEAAFAGALGVSLGGANNYDGVVSRRPTLGDGRPVTTGDIARANTLSQRVGEVSAVLLAAAALMTSRGTSAKIRTAR